MAKLHIPEMLDGAGAHVAATVTVQLVRAARAPGGRPVPVIGFAAGRMATEYRSLPIPVGGLTLDLAPQPSIALPGGAATWYAVDVRSPRTSESLLIQIADIEPVQDLRDLVAAAAIDPLDITAERVQQVIDAADAVAVDRTQTGLDAEATTAAAQIAAAAATAARAAAALTIAMGWR